MPNSSFKNSILDEVYIYVHMYAIIVNIGLSLYKIPMKFDQLDNNLPIQINF